MMLPVLYFFKHLVGKGEMVILDGTLLDNDTHLTFVTENGKPVLDFTDAGILNGGHCTNFQIDSQSANITIGPQGMLVVECPPQYEVGSVSPEVVTGHLASADDPLIIASDWLAYAENPQEVFGVESSQASLAGEFDCVLTGQRSSTKWYNVKVAQTTTTDYTVGLYDYAGTLVPLVSLPADHRVEVFCAAYNSNLTAPLTNLGDGVHHLN